MSGGIHQPKYTLTTVYLNARGSIGSYDFVLISQIDTI